MNIIAARKNGKCVSTEYIGYYNKLLWQCEYIHQWLATPANIIKGRWCPYCSGRRKNSNYLIELAAERGGHCLDSLFDTAKKKIRWKCAKRHIFWATADNVKQGNWCPHCATRHSKAEIEIFEFVKKFFPDAQNGVRGLLISKRLELDIFIPSINKAIEYNGRYWHNDETVKKRDKRKRKECKIKNIKLLYIKEGIFIKNKSLVFERISVFLGIKDAKIK